MTNPADTHAAKTATTAMKRAGFAKGDTVIFTYGSSEYIGTISAARGAVRRYYGNTVPGNTHSGDYCWAARVECADLPHGWTIVALHMLEK